jgi:hypothetical protein
MKIELDDALVTKLERFNAECGAYLSLAGFIESVIEDHMECYPWSTPGDICVHNDECIHCKRVWEWKEEQK